MGEETTTCVIVNPAAQGGRVGRGIDAIEERVRARLGPLTLHCTESAGHGITLAREAVLSGITRVISIGGDGTHNEVVNGIMEAEPAPGAISLGVVPAGTGGDFCRLIDSGSTLFEGIDALATAESIPIDVGWVAFTSDDGSAREGYFLNMASVGIAGLVDRIVNAGSKALGGRATFFIATLRALRQYTAARVRLFIDGDEEGVYNITNIMVCNGQYAGGGMHFAPDSRLNDGLFDVVIVEHESAWRTLSLARLVYSGRHVEEPDIRIVKASQVRVEPVSLDPAWMDVDGEAPGQIPARFRVISGAIRLLGPRRDALV